MLMILLVAVEERRPGFPALLVRTLSCFDCSPCVGHWFRNRSHLRGYVRQTFRLGRLAGIAIGFNWSLLIVVGLFTWTFATYEFPAEFPDRSDVFYWTAAIITTLSFFSCLLAHEMGHALAARRLKVRVEEITLWLFGGVARIRGEDMDARSELRIAVAGPVVSVVLAGLFLGGSWFLSDALSAEVAGGIAGWLGRINLMLALFNLIPAFPMDGGRIMRALLWRRLGRHRATRIAVHMGRGFGFLLIALGLVEASIGDPSGGLWLAFLGWFLANAARAEEPSGPPRRGLGNLRVADVMTPTPPAPAWMTVEAFLQMCAGRPHAGYPLRELDGSTSGLATAAAVARVAPRHRNSTKVRDVACRIENALIARPEELLEQVLARPAGCAPGWVMVFDGDGLAGLVSPADIDRALDVHSRAATKPAG